MPDTDAPKPGKWLRVVNWERFQNYRDRNPPWIKLYRSLLDDKNFTTLPDESKLQLVLLWLIASRKRDGFFEADPKWLTGEIKTTAAVNLQPLIDAGFLEYARREPREKPKPVTTEPEPEDQPMPKAPAKPIVCPPDLAELSLYNDLDQYKDKKGKLTPRGARLRKLWTDWNDVLETWKQAYPGLDIMAEVRSAHAWELENPAKRKVDRRRYLGAWLRRAQDRGRGQQTGDSDMESLARQVHEAFGPQKREDQTDAT